MNCTLVLHSYMQRHKQNSENVQKLGSLHSHHAVVPLWCAFIFKGEVVLSESCSSPFVGIHITDQCFWLALGYCSLFPGHLYGRVNTAAQRLTTSHPTSRVILLSVCATRSVTWQKLCLADVASCQHGKGSSCQDLVTNPLTCFDLWLKGSESWRTFSVLTTVVLIPYSSRRAGREPQHCPRLRLCSSWPWWRLSVGSPEMISRLHLLWWRSDAGHHSLARSGEPGPHAYCGKTKHP